MDYFTTSQSWLSPNVVESPDVNQSQQSPQNGAALPDDWPKSMDLDQIVLSDLSTQASSANTTGVAPIPQLYSFPMSQNGFYHQPFSLLAYGAPATWAQQQSLPLSSYSALNGATGTIGSPQQQEQQQQQQQQQQQAALQSPQSTTLAQQVIDPALTTLNGSHSYSPPVPSSSGQSDQQVQRSPTATTFINTFPSQQQAQQQNGALYLFYPQQHQVHLQQMQQQRTLNPQHLSMNGSYTYNHNISQQSPMQTNLTATTSQTNQVTVPPSANIHHEPKRAPSPTPAERRAKLQASLKPLLSPKLLSNAETVDDLVDALDEHGAMKVDADTRIEIMSKIRDNAGNTFFQSWSCNDDAMSLLSKWLKAGIAGKDEGLYMKTVMPLLHVLDRLPLTLEQLKEHRLGKITMALLKSDSTASPAVKDMASNITKKWRTLLESGNSTKEPTTKKVEIEDKTKKRKLDGVSAKAGPTPKVSVVSGASGVRAVPKTVVKKEKVAVAKTDSSFFSNPKPKPTLPKIPKKPSVSSTAGAATTAAITTQPPIPPPNVAQPSQEDPFQEALKAMRGRPLSAVSTNKMSATAQAAAAANAAAAASIGSPGTSNSTSSDLNRSGKKLKKVTWAPDAELEKVKLIERAIYEDDSLDGSHSAHSIRDLERAEGAAMHIHIFEESIDWYEPQQIEFPPDLDSSERGRSSQEKSVQEERENNTLGALYMDGDIPPSPGEPASQISVEQVDKDVIVMMVGAEIQPFFQQAMSVSDLVGQLAAGNSLPGAAGSTPADPNMGGSMDGNNYGSQGVMSMAVSDAFASAGAGGLDLSKLGLDPGALASLAASLGFNLGVGSGIVPEPGANSNVNMPLNMDTDGAGYHGSQGWNNYAQQHQYSDYGGGNGGGYDDRERDERMYDRGRGGPRGRGSRGGARGRGGSNEIRSKRRCNFYAQGSCRFGDACHFSHEGPPGNLYYD